MYLKTLSMSAQFQSSFPHFRVFVNSPNTDPLIRAQIPLRRTLPSWSNYISKTPSPTTMTYEYAWVRAHSVKSNSLQPHGLQPTRFLCPWDSPGKKTGMGCHFLLQIWIWGYSAKSDSQVYCSDLDLSPELYTFYPPSCYTLIPWVLSQS